MGINRQFFFEHLHENLYPHGIKQSAVDGMDRILDEWEAHHAAKDDRWLAYMLATAYLETGHTMQPVREGFAVSDARAIAILQKSFDTGQLPWVKEPYWLPDSHGQSWFGRGLVQLTHKKNYQTLGKRIGVDLVGHPEKALDMDISIQILFVGMMDGLFTGARLSEFFTHETSDWFNARRIINSTDRAHDVAGYARQFYASISHTV